jgi:hypothetical protein
MTESAGSDVDVEIHDGAPAACAALVYAIPDDGTQRTNGVRPS